MEGRLSEMAMRVQELEEKVSLLESLKTTLDADEEGNVFTEKEKVSVSQAAEKRRKEMEEKKEEFRRKFLIYEQSVQTTQTVLEKRMSILNQFFSGTKGGRWSHSDVMDLFVPRQEELIDLLRESEESVMMTR